MDEIGSNFVAKVILKYGFEFYGRTDDVFKFKRFNDKYLRMDYVYYIKSECTVCNKPYFKRRNNMKNTAHLKCANGAKK